MVFEDAHLAVVVASEEAGLAVVLAFVAPLAFLVPPILPSLIVVFLILPLSLALLLVEMVNGASMLRCANRAYLRKGLVERVSGRVVVAVNRAQAVTLVDLALAAVAAVVVAVGLALALLAVAVVALHQPAGLVRCFFRVDSF